MRKEKLMRVQGNTTNQTRAEHVTGLLQTIPKEHVEREGLIETPWRVAEMYNELFSGYKQRGKDVLEEAIFCDENCTDLVLVKDIPFYSMCEHHIMPFFGTISIAYIPQDGNVIGLSKLPRLVEVYARRLQLQERLGKQIADDIQEVMNPRGVAVIIKAEHTCMTARGIQKPGSTTVTSCTRGSFFLDEKARAELMQLLTY